MLKTPQIRDMDDQQLEATLRETQERLFKLRLQSETERLEAPSEIIRARREIARLKTIQRERELARAAK